MKRIYDLLVVPPSLRSITVQIKYYRYHLDGISKQYFSKIILHMQFWLLHTIIIVIERKKCDTILSVYVLCGCRQILIEILARSAAQIVDGSWIWRAFIRTQSCVWFMTNRKSKKIGNVKKIIETGIHTWFAIHRSFAQCMLFCI